ncbi:putative 6-hexanolactone hydrolase [Aspergillus clavatus NRRL 1]|uniref:Alpha/beta hydrolase fold protein n=1 Tax=Aspergillus clavatus (strain ATCC 1007 / CBS 513.65 / DSM 816 / NCTC 3887 / NRRL 1 / QM 1276 / 107) TaxID=344612 RepID=A1CPD1_ASPCL|nr:alpha/beta hydrolase fold protein [Aspergillus clavatus NRRL 1]EAW07502.1 alpha/beta hydrolase fold protein [Aspergillus clavatus NRRL 1]
MTDSPDNVRLTLLEKADLVPGFLSVLGSALYGAVTGLFRGRTGAKEYGVHVGHAIVRKMVMRFSSRQMQAIALPTSKAYDDSMSKQGLRPQTVTLDHGARGHWIGNPNAKNVVIYYHGGGFALAGTPAHFDLFTQLIADLNANGHDVAFFFLAYTLTPHAVYPTQLQQAIAALRYILTQTHRSPSNVIIGGDSAGGNLALATLLHLLHPHPEIKPLELSAPLAGVFGFAPWVSFAADGASTEFNRYKDLIPKEALTMWASAYLGGNLKLSDAWSEPALAPVEWWAGAAEKTARVLILAGRDELLFSMIDEFVARFKTVVPETTYVVGYGETHVDAVYSSSLKSTESQQGKELKRWLSARL